jgi:hypothetical protein
MNSNFFFSCLAIGVFLLFFVSCDKIYEPIMVRGKVVDVNTSQPVSNAAVSITSPQDLAAQTFSNENGEFLFEEVAVDSVIDITISVFKEGFTTEAITLLAAPERELLVPDLRIRNLQTGQNGGNGEPGGSVGGAAFIELVSLSSQSIRITETAGNVNSAFTFEIQDSTGRAIGPDQAVDVEFRILEGPGGGEAITPSVVRTNELGRVTSNIFAGKIAGNLKIEAKVVRPDIGLTIVSSPILLTIHGGFPNLEHFSIAVRVFNFEGWSINGVRNPITVIVGDKFSNPVKEDTPVYFNTTGGVIQGSGVTDGDGEIVVDLISGNPRPPDGYAIIRAHTFDEDNIELVNEAVVLFSGPPATNTITVSPTTFDIPSGGSQEFQFTVTDINGNPLPFDTSINVEAPDGMAVDGDVDIKVPNTLFGGPGVTQFSFTARDSDDDNDRQQVSIRIVVETPGGFRATRTISGFKS